MNAPLPPAAVQAAHDAATAVAPAAAPRADTGAHRLLRTLAEAGVDTIFGYPERRDDHTMGDLPNHPVMQRWWAYMGDIMATNPDGSPVAIPLAETFYMA